MFGILRLLIRAKINNAYVKRRRTSNQNRAAADTTTTHTWTGGKVGGNGLQTVYRRMVTIKRDKKAKDIWLITTTDGEGFHRQLPITFDDMRELVRLWIDEIV